MDNGLASPKSGGMRREISKGLGLVAVLLLLMMWLSGVFITKVQPGPAAQKVKHEGLKTWKAAKAPYPLIIEQPGTVRAKVEAQISSRIMAQVKEILVHEGDALNGSGASGQPTLIATLDDREIRARIRQAEAQVAAADRGIQVAKSKLSAATAQTASARANSQKASTDFRRFQALADSKAISGQQLDHSRAQRDMADAQLRAAQQEAQAVQGEIERATAQQESAKAALAEVQTMLTYTQIYAPFDGKLLKKMVDTGDMASPGQALFLAESDRQPEFHVNISESILPHLRQGQELYVRVDALNRTFTATLREITPQSDPGTRTVLVKLRLPADSQLVNGLFGRLAIPYGEYEALTVPADCVEEVGQLYLLLVLDGQGYSQRRFVTLGRRHDSLVEVLSGLNENEEVICP